MCRVGGPRCDGEHAKEAKEARKRRRQLNREYRKNMVSKVSEHNPELAQKLKTVSVTNLPGVIRELGGDPANYAVEGFVVGAPNLTEGGEVKPGSKSGPKTAGAFHDFVDAAVISEREEPIRHRSDSRPLNPLTNETEDTRYLAVVARRGQGETRWGNPDWDEPLKKENNPWYGRDPFGEPKLGFGENIEEVDPRAFTKNLDDMTARLMKAETPDEAVRNIRKKHREILDMGSGDIRALAANIIEREDDPSNPSDVARKATRELMDLADMSAQQQTKASAISLAHNNQPTAIVMEHGAKVLESDDEKMKKWRSKENLTKDDLPNGVQRSVVTRYAARAATQGGGEPGTAENALLRHVQAGHIPSMVYVSGSQEERQKQLAAALDERGTRFTRFSPLTVIDSDGTVTIIAAENGTHAMIGSRLTPGSKTNDARGVRQKAESRYPGETDDSWNRRNADALVSAYTGDYSDNQGPSDTYQYGPREEAFNARTYSRRVVAMDAHEEAMKEGHEKTVSGMRDVMDRIAERDDAASRLMEDRDNPALEREANEAEERLVEAKQEVERTLDERAANLESAITSPDVNRMRLTKAHGGSLDNVRKALNEGNVGVAEKWSYNALDVGRNDVTRLPDTVGRTLQAEAIRELEEIGEFQGARPLTDEQSARVDTLLRRYRDGASYGAGPSNPDVGGGFTHWTERERAETFLAGAVRGTWWETRGEDKDTRQNKTGNDVMGIRTGLVHSEGYGIIAPRIG